MNNIPNNPLRASLLKRVPMALGIAAAICWSATAMSGAGLPEAPGIAQRYGTEHSAYKGVKICVVGSGDNARLYVGGKLVNTVYLSDTDSYGTYLLPFEEYDTLLDMAIDLIDLKVYVG